MSVSKNNGAWPMKELLSRQQKSQEGYTYRDSQYVDLQAPADHISQPSSEGPANTSPYNGHHINVRSPRSDLTHGKQVGDNEGHKDIVSRAHCA